MIFPRRISLMKKVKYWSFVFNMRSFEKSEMMQKDFLTSRIIWLAKLKKFSLDLRCLDYHWWYEFRNYETCRWNCSDKSWSFSSDSFNCKFNISILYIIFLIINNRVLVLGAVYLVLLNLMYMVKLFTMLEHVETKEAKHHLNLIIRNSFLLMMEVNDNMVVKYPFVLNLNTLFQVIFLH